MSGGAGHQTSPRQFPGAARRAMGDDQLQHALGKLKRGFVGKRAQAVAKLPEFEDLREAARRIKDHTLAHLDRYLEAFEAGVIAAGGEVHWAADAEEAREIVGELCRRYRVGNITKGKSMVSEEIGLNAFLEDRGLEVVETDLGEYIIQLGGDVPSHIVAPAIHLTRERVAELFHEKHRTPKLREIPELMAEARAVMRQHFLGADMGITGANFLVAETGTCIIVTNEGNGDLTMSLPKVHVVVTSIEKAVPTLEDASILLRLLARSASGQEISAYTTFFTGPKRGDDADGPDAFHVVLVDNGRSAMLGTPFQDMLRCIKCGACLNHCPVYQAVGGHPYGSVYPGPMGAVLTPQLVGIGEAGHLPNASSFCGRCEEVCPVKIPLPKMMRHWREREFERHLSPRSLRMGLWLWQFLAARPRLYHLVSGLARRFLHVLGGRGGTIRRLPLGWGWTAWHDLPAPSRPRGFLGLWRKGIRS